MGNFHLIDGEHTVSFDLSAEEAPVKVAEAIKATKARAFAAGEAAGKAEAQAAVESANAETEKAKTELSALREVIAGEITRLALIQDPEKDAAQELSALESVEPAALAERLKRELTAAAPAELSGDPAPEVEENPYL